MQGRTSCAWRMLERVDIRMALVLWVSGVLELGTFREGGWSLGDQVWMSSSFVFLYLSSQMSSVCGAQWADTVCSLR